MHSVWFQNNNYLYYLGFKSPKKGLPKSNSNSTPPLIVIVEDLEAMPAHILNDLTQICRYFYIFINRIEFIKSILFSEYRQRSIPFVFIFGVSTTPSAIHRNLNHDASSSLAIETFQAQPSSALLNQVIDKVKNIIQSICNELNPFYENRSWCLRRFLSKWEAKYSNFYWIFFCFMIYRFITSSKD